MSRTLVPATDAVSGEDYLARDFSVVDIMLGHASFTSNRLSAHPDLLRVAESLNEPDFVPHDDSIFLKESGIGAAVAWHQDGTRTR